MNSQKKPKIGLAFSGSGNRTTFYIGFLEALTESGINIDYITACSGGSIVAAAYACGTLQDLKTFALKVSGKEIRSLFKRSSVSGGIYTIEPAENELRKLFTKGKRFEELPVKLAFLAVDIESGETVTLCLGDVAKAACISCTLPGIIEPQRWGDRTLVDGGILTTVPIKALISWSPDITIGIDIRGTQHIFTNAQTNFKKAFNFIKKIFFVEELEIAYNYFLKDLNESNFKKPRNMFAVLGKSLDIAISANSVPEETEKCDLMITLDPPIHKKLKISNEVMHQYYNIGRQTALDNLEKIEALINLKKND